MRRAGTGHGPKGHEPKGHGPELRHGLGLSIGRATIARNQGVTLVELMITISILAVILTMVGSFFLSSQYTYQTSMLKSGIETNAHRAVAMMADELRNAGASTIAPVPAKPAGATSITFQVNERFQDGAIVWSNPITYSLAYEPGETADAADENGNGLVNEMVLVRTKDGRTVRMAGFVREDGLRFLLDGSRLSIRIELERLNARRESETTYAETAIVLRN